MNTLADINFFTRIDFDSKFFFQPFSQQNFQVLKIVRIRCFKTISALGRFAFNRPIEMAQVDNRNFPFAGFEGSFGIKFFQIKGA